MLRIINQHYLCISTLFLKVIHAVWVTLYILISTSLKFICTGLYIYVLVHASQLHVYTYDVNYCTMYTYCVEYISE